ncbi:MAG: CoA pyrophosphatase [Flavobacteriales bacterium]|nr:CoA pyrophosphatase [Flavobacteriales bacterium]
MDFSTLYEKLNAINSGNLPGEDSQFKMVPSIRPNLDWDKIEESKPTKASVLLLIYPENDNDCKFVLIQRNVYNGAHSAQISLPGGKHEGDESLEETALRETYEEIGVDVNRIELISPLSKVWVSPSKFLVTPFVGVITQKPVFVKDDHEVAEIIEVKLSEFLSDNCISTSTVNSSYVKDLVVPSFSLNNKIIWGATAMILSEFRDIVLSV